MDFLDAEIDILRCSQIIRHYRVSAGPVEFCIGMLNGNAFVSALEAFLRCQPVEAPPENIPIVFVCDSPSLIDRCSILGYQELTNAQERSKLSRNQQLFNWDPQRGLLKYFNAETQAGLLAARDLTKLPSWEWFSPLKEFVHLFALEKGAWLAHAAAVGANSLYGVLLVGPGGSGKSTACANLIQSNSKTCGDDYVLLRKEVADVCAYGIYLTIKLVPRFDLHDGMQQVATSKQLMVAETGKLVSYFNFEQSSSLIPRMFIKEIYGLRLVDQLATPIKTLRLGYNHFAMSSHGQIPIWLDQSLSVSRSIFESLPKKMLEIRRDKKGLEALTQTIKDFFASCSFQS